MRDVKLDKGSSKNLRPIFLKDLANNRRPYNEPTTNEAAVIFNGLSTLR